MLDFDSTKNVSEIIFALEIFLKDSRVSTNKRRKREIDGLLAQLNDLEKLFSEAQKQIESERPSQLAVQQLSVRQFLIDFMPLLASFIQVVKIFTGGN